MSREMDRKDFYNNRDPRNRDYRDPRDRPQWGRSDYRNQGRKSRSPMRRVDRRRSRSPRKNDKDNMIDDNILSEISKLPEPNELWDNNHFQDGGYSAPPPPPGVSDEHTVNYDSGFQSQYAGLYDDFPPLASAPMPAHPPDVASWNQMSLPPPPTVAPQPNFMPSAEDQLKKEAAIESEMRHQKAALSKQREDYMKKASILKKELDTLKDQRNELRGDSKRSPSPDTQRFLKENTKLQLEIQNKLKTINNVVDMLNGIIGEEAQEPITDESSNSTTTKRKSRSPSGGKFNYVYYDPEMHWCRVCNEFPPTAKDYLNHLHSPAHHKMAAAHMEAPWHSVSGVNEGFPNYPTAPTKRTPIRGLQFFVPSTAWYCKLCDQFIGDLHCASAHLKSLVHSKNYTNFVEQNPHWETDWMSDRQKAFEKSRNSKKPVEEKPQYTAHTITFNKDGFHTKEKDNVVVKKEKKKKGKKKESSSESSSSESSSDSEPKKKPKKKEKIRQTSSISDWMREGLNDNDRKLLDTIKQRMKQEKEEKRESLDRDRTTIILEREKAERETRARKIKEERGHSRGRREDIRRREERGRRVERDRRPSPKETKKPELKKMPFIGKMPVYKSLTKTKTEEIKKEEEKKKEDDEANKKRREEMDAEIQKKVAEFKDKIAKAQLERQQQVANMPPPGVALPVALPVTLPALPATPQPQPPPPQPPPPAAPVAQKPAPALPKDFQEALDIIFPTEVKCDLSNPDIFNAMAQGLPPGFPMGLGLPPFPPFLQPPMPPQMPPMMGFDLNNPMFQPRPQLYDTHVPLVTTNQNQKRQNKNNSNNNNKGKMFNKGKGKQIQQRNQNNSMKKQANGNVRKQEEMDDLAMLGIDASDVGSGM